MLKTKIMLEECRKCSNFVPEKKYLCNLNHYLARMIADELAAFLNECEQVEGAPAELVFEAGTVARSAARWRQMLQEMIWSFNEIAKGWPQMPNDKELRRLCKALHNIARHRV